jgi:hypothetical protein
MTWGETIELLKEEGFTIEIKNNTLGVNTTHQSQTSGNITIRAKKTGIRIDMSQSVYQNVNPHVNYLIEVYVRTESGGYKVHMGYNFLPEATDLKDTLQNIKVPEMIKPKIECYTFSEPMYKREESHHNLAMNVALSTWSLKIHCQIATITVAPVTLEEDGRITTDNLADPKSSIWFLCDCTNFFGATYDFITDGEKVYPINRYGNKKITATVSPKATVKLNKLSKFDQQIVHRAIEEYKNGI